jgi:hypothetical protein
MLTGRKTRFSVLRSIIRPTVNWVSAPHRVTTKAARPINGAGWGFRPASPLLRRFDTDDRVGESREARIGKQVS